MSSRIAIIGGGITGLTAAYLLTEKYNIALFESLIVLAEMPTRTKRGMVSCSI